jgi:methyltransferase
MMLYWFSCWFAAVIAQRLLELQLANRNTQYMKRVGGYEVGADHYPRIVGLHVAFFIVLLLEFSIRRPELELWMAGPLAVFLLLQAARVWCIRSLGPRWNTRIYIVPGAKLVRRGPYRWLRHPNYVVITLELMIFPLLFGCFLTAAVFPLLNILVLRKRIEVENQALHDGSAVQSTS